MEKFAFPGRKARQNVSMELLYIWIEDYKNIHHQGFNFSPQFRFFFEPELENNEIKGGNLLNKTADIYESKDNYKDFFLPSKNSLSSMEQKSREYVKNGKISNVTAVIGENGAGKSTLFEFIKFFLNSRILIKNSVLMIYREKDKLFYFFSAESVEINLQNGLNISRTPRTIDPILVYYSNTLNFQRNDFSREKIVSVSLSSHFSDDSKSVWDIYIEDLKFKLEFIKGKSNIQIPFKIQDCISVSIFKIQNILRTNFHPNPGADSNIILFLRDLSLKILEISNRNKPAIFLNELKFKHINRIAEYVIEELKGEEEKEYFLKICKEYFSNSLKASFDNFSVFLAMVSGNILASTKVKSLNKEFEILLEAISNRIENKNDYIIIPEDYSGILVKLDFSISQFMEIFKEYEGIKYKYFDISFPGLSSGEESFLSLFSRFYYSRKKIEEIEKTSMPDLNHPPFEDILILIDEGEIGFHPEWQKSYLKNLVDFFPKIFPERNIQIVITSHSPFLVSDLPKENMIFLRKGQTREDLQGTNLELKGKFKDGTEKEGKCIVVDGLKVAKTFGANIHTLLSDSFFMNSGLLGDFAKEKIIHLMKEISGISPSTSEMKIKKYEGLIGLIGEPVLAQKLKMLLEEKINEKKPKEFIRNRLQRQKAEIDMKIRELEND